ncbi:MAG: hypothetical protein ACK56F_01620, partial [bacterium]
CGLAMSIIWNSTGYRVNLVLVYLFITHQCLIGPCMVFTNTLPTLFLLQFFLLLVPGLSSIGKFFDYTGNTVTWSRVELLSDRLGGATHSQNPKTPKL